MRERRAELTTVVVGVAMGGLIVSCYLVVVAGGRTLTADDDGLLLPILATAIVAVAYEPTRRRVQRAANRWLLGTRATPLEVLADLTERLSSTRDRRAALQHVATLLQRGTSTDAVVVWLATDRDLVPEVVAGTWQAALDTRCRSLDELPGDLVHPIVHDAEVLGAIALHTGGAEVREPDRDLVTDVSRSIGLLLFNLRLDERLRARADELHASRRRVVAAQDAARRRLERDLHDGAQQQVVAVKVKLGLAATLAAREGAQAHQPAVTELARRTQEAIEALRRVAHGIYPPLLAAEGLTAALRSLPAIVRTPVDLEVEEVDRHPEDLEATAWFVVLAALREIDRRGVATRATVTLARRHDALVVTVADEGREDRDDRGRDVGEATAHGHDGDDAHDATADAHDGNDAHDGDDRALLGEQFVLAIRDRLSAVNGRLDVAVVPGRGTHVRGTIPLADEHGRADDAGTHAGTTVAGTMPAVTPVGAEP